MIARFITKWTYGLKVCYEWKNEATFAERFLISMVFAFITGVAAQLNIRLPFTPVPVTCQVFVVLLSGALLGRTDGAISQCIYFLGGMAGVPWFAGGKAGFFLLPSLGYIAGFIPASWIVGYLTDSPNRSLSRYIFSMLCGVLIVYIFGATWFSFLTGCDLKHTLLLAVLPFIPVDIIKAYLAAYLAMAFTPDFFLKKRC